MYYFNFKDETAHELYANSEAVKRFNKESYPNLVGPVECSQYELYSATAY